MEVVLFILTVFFSALVLFLFNSSCMNMNLFTFLNNRQFDNRAFPAIKAHLHLKVLAREYPSYSMLRALHFWMKERISLDYRTYLICESECSHTLYRWKFFENMPAEKLKVIEQIHGEWLYIFYQLLYEEDMPGRILCDRAKEMIVFSLLVLLELNVWDLFEVKDIILHLMCYDRE